MTSEKYKRLKEYLSLSPIPSTIMSVEKLPDGSCGEMRFVAINEPLKKNYYEIFMSGENDQSIPFEDAESKIEGQLYNQHLPKEPNFEAVCLKAAWDGQFINTYVDTTKIYGFWTQDIINPIAEESDDPNIRFCQFSYTLNKEMDTGKFATVSPDIASFVIKSCLELRNEKEFHESMENVTRDLREYTDSYAASIVTIDKEARTFEVVSVDVRNNDKDIKKVFSKFPYEIVESWEALCQNTNDIIIKDEHDIRVLEKKAPEWVRTLRENDVESLCLVPFVRQGDIIGYLYITNFDVSSLVRIKETVELLSFFLTAEIANYTFLQKLEYLSNVDILTGVYNRNCMNTHVDELSTKLKLHPVPFSVAFCDLNGLKTINDKDGHNDGDRLLKDAANLLKEIFEDDLIFRAGGDEFTIISLESSEEEFEEKIKELREEACDPDWLCFAVGHYHDESSGNLRLALRYADERMYKDKDAYYEKHPEKRR
ncbi:MAG: GGDEF domain-containing protein [Butyrivibrio sp.]|nr:GGDEF domain-containing protein [Butyrivibrio sp.]